MNVLDLIQHNSSQLEMFAEPLRVIGIDLGTTNSTVAEITFDPAKDDLISAYLPLASKMTYLVVCVC